MRKVLFIGPTDPLGGVGHMMYLFAQNLNTSIFSVDFMDYSSASKEALEIMSHLGGEFTQVSPYSKNFIKYVRDILRFYKNKKYDIVHCHASTATQIMYVFPLWFQHNTKIIYHSHSQNNCNVLLQFFFRILVNRYADVKLAISRSSAVWMYGIKNVEKEKIIILKNGIELDKFKFDIEKRVSLRKTWNTKSLCIGHIGRFSNEKNHFKIVEVFEEILLRDKNAKIILVGKGNLKYEVENILKQKRLSGNVIFLESVVDVEGFMSAIDVFLFPSKYEGLGLVTIEAQAVGTPVVASEEIPIEAKILENFVQLKLSAPASEWAKQVIEVYERGRTAKSAWAVELAGYDINQVVQKLEKIYLTEMGVLI